MQRLFVIAMLASAAVCGTASAQDEPNRGNSGAALEITMTLLPANAQTPDAVTKVIELPKDTDGNPIPSAAGIEHSAGGLETANAARENGRAFGEAASAAARANRENATRASRDAASGERPNPPEPPDRPSPPER